MSTCGVAGELKGAVPATPDANLCDIPRTLRDATATLQLAQMLRAALGNGVVDHFVHTARWEQLEYDRRVTDWELMHGVLRC